MMDDRTKIQPLLTLNYRCVCGESFDIPAGEKQANCPRCDRHYSAEAFQRAAAETLSVDGKTGVALREKSPTDHDEQDPRIGQTIDHFRIVGVLGRGGMGDVYKAIDESLQRYVALKVISTGNNTAHGSTRGGKIVEEARAQARVNHPNVVHIYYVGKQEDAPFFAMELVSGPTLADRLDDGPLPFDEVIRIGLQVVDALEQAAAFDIVHGDIKPSNLLIADNDVVKLSDFGLAQRLSQSDEHSHSITGTPDYLSPEAARGEALVQQSDMYSLGVMLFQLTFGLLPYPGETSSLMEKLETHKSSPVTFPDPWPVSIPEPFRELLMRMMAKQPADRFANYHDLRQALRKLQPVTLPRAGTLPRALAWLVDLALAMMVWLFTFGLLHMLAAVAEFQWGFARLSWVHFLILCAATMVPAAAAALQTWWGTTPGKRMFQLRMVTPMGLAPPSRVLAARSLFQFAPLWLLIAGAVLTFIAPQPLVTFITGSGYALLALDAAMAIFHPTGRSLHDWALHTRVVLAAS